MGSAWGQLFLIFVSGFCVMITGKRKPDRHRNELAKTIELPSIFFEIRSIFLEIPDIFLESPGIVIVFLIFSSISYFSQFC